MLFLKLDPIDSPSVGQLLRQQEIILVLKKQRHHPKSCRLKIVFLVLLVPQTEVFVVTCSPDMLCARLGLDFFQVAGFFYLRQVFCTGDAEVLN
jgi:hypothetical protein